MYKKLAPYFTHDDGRGQIVGVVNEGEWREINSISSEAGAVRGNHYHSSTIELFLVLSGKIEVTVQRVEDRVLTGPEESFFVGPGDVFLVEKNVNHVFKILEDAHWINMLSQPIDPSSPDIHSVA